VTLRRAVALALLTTMLAFGTSAVAGAYEGTSLFDNIAPPSQSHGHSEDYQLSSYGLDTHIGPVVPTFHTPILPDVIPKGPPDFTTIAPTVLSAFTDGIFTIHRWLAALTLMLFDFAWSFDLIHLALQPVRIVSASLYRLLGGDAFLIVIVCVAAWAAVRSFRGAIASTLAQLGVSAVLVLVCLFLVFQGGRVADGVSRTVNGLSPALLAAVTGGDSGTSTADAQKSAKDALHDLMLRRPWMIFQFGGLNHCLDRDGKPVNPFGSACRTKVSNEPYAKLYLKAGEPNGKGRTLVYDAISKGHNPSPDQIDEAGVPRDLFNGVTLSDKDKAGVDMQQQPAVYERFGAVVLALAGGIGLDWLIGGLSAAVVVAQAVFLLLLMLAAVVLLAAPIPRFGHTIFHEYLGKLFFTGTRKLWNTLILALAVAILTAIQSTASSIGVLASTGLGCLFAWALVIGRDDIYDKIQRALSGRSHGEHRTIGQHARDIHSTARVARPVANLAVATAGLGPAAAVGTAKLSRAGMRQAGVMANEYAAGGHAATLAAAAAEQGGARQVLERQRQGATRRLREERARRARIEELQDKQKRAAKSTTTTTSGRPPVAFTAADAKELGELKRGAMKPAAYKHLRDEVTATDRRERETGDPFTQEQVNGTARRASAADRKTNGRTHRRESPEQTAEKARRWRNTHDRLFGGAQRERDAAERDAARRGVLPTDWDAVRAEREAPPSAGSVPPASGPKPGSKPPPPPKGK
jgi:hypothetical protein